MTRETTAEDPREAAPDLPNDESGPLGRLPWLSRKQADLERLVTRAADGPRLREVLAWVDGALGTPLEIGTLEVLDRVSGLGRPGVIAQWTWPRLSTRLALGIETPIAHALVDRLLGFDRNGGEHRLQVTPVEWGILTYGIARTLDRLGERPGSLGPWDLTLDRVGPEPFSPKDLGPIVTLRWPVTVGPVSGSVRLWLPDSLIARWLNAAPLVPDLDESALRGRLGTLAGVWRAEAGSVTMPRGLGRLRVGGVLPIDGFPLRGTVASPSGPVSLVLRDRDGRSVFAAEPAPNSSGGRLVLTAPLRREPLPREAHPVSMPSESSPAGAVAPTDVPVTLTVELGRVNLPLARLADLKPGDVVELNRHAREPVELTSNGRLVARGELVQIDTELGVRVTNVFL